MKFSMFRNCCLAIIATIALSSCDKEETTPKADDYSPLTVGSSWTYQNTPGTPYTLTVTNRDTVAAGKTYKVLSNSSGGSNYLGKNGNDYYRFGAFSAVGLTAVEELYLKDNQAVNATWSASQVITVPSIPFPLTANLTYTIKSKDGVRTVAGKAFNKVTFVRLDLAIAGYGSIGGGDFYYAEGVGLIESLIIVNAPGQPTINQAQLLTSYTIK